MGTYHPGERAVQARSGLTDPADHAGRSIRATIPDVAARFLAAQRVLVLGAADHDGRVWSSLLTGDPGFLRVRDERTVDVAAALRDADPLAGVLRDGTVQVGAIALDPVARRRMRVNGTARGLAPEGLRVTADQVYANCPKYIQRRELTPSATADAAPTRGGRLTGAQQEVLRRADTFFVATAGASGAADASHRGGDPGFLTVHSPELLSWPDYTGNAMFMTLGNLWVNPRAGLLVPDWETGDLLQITGTARVRWADGAPGAPRSVEFTVEEVVASPGAGLLSPGPPEYSRANPPVAAATAD
ncbi:pyridoxamine 5'-phosphate oxidase family protein [Nocardiopsis sp. EMB25]|uniref:pyridoxamine 5'-phosphate oxidase family protein n=1 Tax=Nocardiopsis sp. EMB25 TaxID=2835867 RepID=UPI002284ADDD|nr:pyridoxamine 5'-phosphate oxidase family protein [Nocardiopsis sp. EMB25]MCY9783056.1 pyridoxamine 5'-phosphate oxidase family protein [Nocardiopsis sp. EMB25]